MCEKRVSFVSSNTKKEPPDRAAQIVLLALQLFADGRKIGSDML